MANTERGGVCQFYAGGAYYEVGADITVKQGGFIRTAKDKSDGTAGSTSKWVAPEVTLTAIDGPQVSVTALKAINGVTVQLNQRNGKSWLLYGAFQVDDPEVKISTGDISALKFSGIRCVEQLATS